MRGRLTLVLVVVAAAVAAVVGSGDEVLADVAGATEPQFFDTLGTAGSDDGELQNPKGVAVDPESGDVYVADTGNDRIVRYDADGRLVDIFGTDPIEGLPLDEPWDVAVSEVAGEVYVADTGNNKVKAYNPVTGTFTGSYGTRGSGSGQLNGPRDVTGDSDHGTRLFIADTGNDRISVWNLVNGRFVGTFGSAGTGNRRFEAPAGIWEGGDTAATESIFVADTGNDRVSVWRYDAGTETATWESRFGTTGDRHEEFEAPRNVAVDQGLRRYVIDTANDRLQLLDPSGPPGITGTVSNTLGARANGIAVLAQDATTFDMVLGAETDRDGNYQLALPPGSYRLTFFDPDHGHGTRYYPSATTFDQGQPVAVSANTVTRADITLPVVGAVPNQNTGAIVGTVQEAAGLAARTWVLVVDGTGTLVQAAQADPAGRYRVDGLATDNYLVVFVDPRGVNATEFFSNQSDPALANQVVVTSGGSAALVNAFLQP